MTNVAVILMLKNDQVYIQLEVSRRSELGQVCLNLFNEKNEGEKEVKKKHNSYIIT